MKKYTIWCDTYFMDMESLKVWEAETRAYLMEDCGNEPSESEIYERIQEENGFFYEDERKQLDAICLPESILCVADIGRWNGRVCGYREFDDLKSCLYSNAGGISYCEWYVDQYGNFRGTEAHHDGTNAYLYRMWKPGLSDERKENLLYKIYCGKATTADINRYTVRLGDYIGAEYGWKFSGTAPACVRA